MGGLLVCFLPHETLHLEAFIGSGYAADVHGVRDDWAATAAVAGVAEAAFGSASCAQGGSSHSHLDCAQRYDRPADGAERWANADLPGT